MQFCAKNKFKYRTKKSYQSIKPFLIKNEKGKQVNRYQLLKEWMRNNQVTFAWAGHRLGLTETGVRRLLMKDRMPPNRHQQFIDLRFPEHLLPRPEAVSTGRRAMVPVWEQEEGGASASA